MPTPPSLVQFGETEGSIASGSPVTTPSLSWQADDVVVLFSATDGSTGGETMAAPTTTGTGISFGAAQQLHQSAGSDCGGGCWAAVATGNSSGTFSVVATHSGGARQKLIGVYIFRGSAGIGNSNIYTGTSPTGLTLTPAGADGAICWMVLDWHADAVQSFTPAATTHSAASPGPTASPVSALVSSVLTYYLADLDDQSSAGNVAYGIGGSGAGPFTNLVIEVKAAASGGADFTATPGSADGAGAGYDAAAQIGAATSALFAGSATGISGSWGTTSNATGSTQGTYATWTDSAAGSSAVLELAAFGAGAAVPAGSTVQSVTCVVRHGEAPSSAVASVTAQAYSGATPVGSAQPLSPADAVHDDTVTFTGLAYADLADLRVRVTVTRT